MSKNLIVVKSNDFVEASYKLTLDEMRVLLLTIGKIDSEALNHRRDFEFTVAEFAEKFSTDEKSAYKQVQTAVDKLGGRWALVESTPKYDRKVTFLTQQIYFKSEGRFKIILHEDLIPFVSEIKGKFTQYRLEHIAKFNGFHSIRLYEILVQYKSIGWREVIVSDLKSWLQVADKYERWNNFKARVLDPAITEINEKSDLFIEVEQIKRGRTIHALNFVINHKKQAVENGKNITKSGRPKLPQRPQVLKGSQAEYDWARDCIKALDKWRKSLLEQGKKLSVTDLELLAKYYKIINDTITVESIEQAILRRKAKEATS